MDRNLLSRDQYLLSRQIEIFSMHYPTHIITHDTAFVAPVSGIGWSRTQVDRVSCLSQQEGQKWCKPPIAQFPTLYATIVLYCCPLSSSKIFLFVCHLVNLCCIAKFMFKQNEQYKYNVVGHFHNSMYFNNSNKVIFPLPFSFSI